MQQRDEQLCQWIHVCVNGHTMYIELFFFFRTILDLAISVGHIVSFIFHFEMQKSQIPCQVLGYLFEFSLISANLWYAFLAYDLIKAVRNPFG